MANKRFLSQMSAIAKSGFNNSEEEDMDSTEAVFSAKELKDKLSQNDDDVEFNKIYPLDDDADNEADFNLVKPEVDNSSKDVDLEALLGLNDEDELIRKTEELENTLDESIHVSKYDSLDEPDDEPEIKPEPIINNTPKEEVKEEVEEEEAPKPRRRRGRPKMTEDQIQETIEKKQQKEILEEEIKITPNNEKIEKDINHNIEDKSNDISADINVNANTEVNINTKNGNNSIELEVLGYVCNQTINNLINTYKSKIYTDAYVKELFSNYINGKTDSSNPLFRQLIIECVQEKVSDPYLGDDLTIKVLNYIGNLE